MGVLPRPWLLEAFLSQGLEFVCFFFVQRRVEGKLQVFDFVVFEIEVEGSGINQLLNSLLFIRLPFR